MFPKYLWLFGDFCAAHHALLHQQHGSELLQQVARIAGNAPRAAELRCERLDLIELTRHAALVEREQSALAEDLRDDLQPLNAGGLERGHTGSYAFPAAGLN